MKITEWEGHTMNGRFQSNKAGTPLVYHCDEQTWAACIYMTPNAPVATGTSFFQHRETKLRGGEENIHEAFNGKTFVDRTPGTFIETKKYSLAWHYRMTDPELAKIRTIELNTVLTSMVENNDLSILKGNKVIEIKSSNVNKGRAVSRLIMQQDYDFITVIGDDWTDEYMFEEAPDWAYTIKVGFNKTKAMYQIKDPEQVRQLLYKLIY